MPPAKNYRDEKYKKLLEDPDIKRWYNNLKKGSIIVADIYLRRLGSFCESQKMTPNQYAKLPLVKMEDMAQDFVDHMELPTTISEKTGKPFAPSYIGSYLKAIKSWAEHRKKVFQRRIAIADSNKRPTLKDERSPTPEELHRVLYAASTPARTRASIALIAFGGSRWEVQGDYLGLEGLRIKDFPEMKITPEGVVFTVIPTMVIIREELSKNGHEYFTFINGEGCEVIKAHLDPRIKEEEKFTPETPIISTREVEARRMQALQKSMNIEDKSPFIRTTKIGNLVRVAMREVGLPWRPYVWRTYFDSAMITGEMKGMMAHPVLQFLMGHKGDIEAQYTTNKHRLPDKMIDAMRKSYSKVSSAFLETKGRSIVNDELKNALKQQLLEIAGFKPEETEKMKLSEMTNEQVQETIRKRLFGMMQNNGSGKIVVPVGEVKDYLPKGYDFVSNLGNGEAILKLPFID